MLEISLLTDEPSVTQKIFDEAIHAHPDYYYLYSRMAFHLMPRRGGSVEQVEQFGDNMFHQTRGLEKYIVYNFIMGKVSRAHRLDTFFDTYNIDWERMKKGYQTRERLYGKCHHLRANYLKTAYHKNDEEVIRSLLNFFEKNWDQAAWKKMKTCSEIREQYSDKPSSDN